MSFFKVGFWEYISWQKYLQKFLRTEAKTTGDKGNETHTEAKTIGDKGDEPDTEAKTIGDEGGETDTVAKTTGDKGGETDTEAKTTGEKGDETEEKVVPEEEQQKTLPLKAKKNIYVYYKVLNCVIGVIFMVIASYLYANHQKTLHENLLWFSQIEEVKREISFRTESGLYYSYYKQLLDAPDILTGIDALMQDNKTEYGNTINILARMNVYQEVILAIIYKSFEMLQDNVLPIYFYIDSIFFLHGMLISAIYCMAWYLSGTWIAGIMTAVWYTTNRIDTTRLNYVIPLRESFSLPFLWLQLLGITIYLKSGTRKLTQGFLILAVGLCTFCFSLFWQFNQYILLLQAIGIFCLETLSMIPQQKALVLYFIQLISLMGVCLLQFMNPMIISGVAVSFVLAALVMAPLKNLFPKMQSLLKGCLQVVCIFIAQIFLTASINCGIKKLVNHKSDSHINRFIMQKFGFGDPRDFDVNLYLCAGGFNFLEWSTFVRLTEKFLLPFYVVVQIAFVIYVVVKIFQTMKSKTLNKDCPADDSTPIVSFHAVMPLLFGAVAITTVRLKFLWTPYMCILASVGICNPSIICPGLKKFVNKFGILKDVLPLCVLVILLYKEVPLLVEELGDLREFYDPNTVELMDWISAAVPVSSVFTGSMQLLAGVKLCTGRPITNHPHYEDEHLRARTKELYQIYARKSPEEVFDILNRYGTQYIILEDSICLAPARDGCNLKDLLDIDNGMVSETGDYKPGLSFSSIPRFCDEVRHQDPRYRNHFELVFQNPTFRIYKVVGQVCNRSKDNCRTA